jgi:hypothetical protein
MFRDGTGELAGHDYELGGSRQALDWYLFIAALFLKMSNATL